MSFKQLVFGGRPAGITTESKEVSWDLRLERSLNNNKYY